MIALKSLLSTASGLAIALAGTGALAQTASPPVISTQPDGAASSASASAPTSEIVVTGSRIARRDFVSDTPILSLGAAAVQNTGQITVEKALDELPQFAGSLGETTAGSNATALNGGQSYASLRGLGPKRTLVLLDGRRLMPSNPDGSIDLDTIPDALIDNVEVITGGASAVYGSDATAGVVNFKLKPRFNGAEFDVQYGQDGAGDGAQYRATATIGGNLPDDKGNAVLSFDYSNREAAYNQNYSFFDRRPSVAGPAATPEGEAVFGANQPTAAAVNAIFVGKYGVTALPGNAAGKYTGALTFNTDQTLASENGVPIENFRDPQTDNDYFIGQQVNYSYLQNTLNVPLERYSVFGKATYDLAPHVQAFGQFSYVQADSSSDTNPTLAGNQFALSVPVTNPFITSDFASILASRPNPGAAFTFNKALEFLGPRTQIFDYNVVQLVGGLTGDIQNTDWTWDLTASYGSSDFNNRQLGGASASAIAALLTSPSGGANLCAGGFNPFGNVIPSLSCQNYIERTTNNQTSLDQEYVEANLQGGLLPLPAGDLKFALGADYRRNAFTFKPDSQLDLPNGTSDILGYTVLLPTSGEVDAYEIYGELLIPVLKDLPFVKAFNLDLGYRFSDYNVAGGLSTYKADFDWSIISMFRLRGGYNRAARAPSPGELYAPVATGSTVLGAVSATTTAGDPCDIRSYFRQGSNAAQVRALCLAQGIPAAIIDSYQGSTTQVAALTGGNPDLKPELADTYSIGGVFQPHSSMPLFRRLSLSVDYYNITINKAIGTLSIVTSVPSCFNAGGQNPTYSQSNYYCSLLTRNPVSGQLADPLQPLLNLATFKVSGVDTQLDWSFGLGAVGLRDEWGSLALNVAVSYLDSFSIQSLPGGPSLNYAGTIGESIDTVGGIAHPDWKSVTSLTYSYGPASLGFVWRYIDAMKDFSRVTTPTSTTFGVHAYNVLDMNARWQVRPNIEFRLGVTNLTDRDPPQVGNTVPNTDLQDYDYLGRTYYVALKAKI